MSEALIFGAGKIARGFLGQILFNAGIGATFVDVNPELVELMNRRGCYHVRVLGAPGRDSVVNGYRALALSDESGIQNAARDARVIFTAVGGKNLETVAPAIALALRTTNRAVNVVTCENWKQPARIIESGVRAVYPQANAGFAEAVVMRSAIEPSSEQLKDDPLTVNVQNFWRLPLDADALVTQLPDVPELEPLHDFKGFLERKFYTYNAANGTVSYIGALLGLRLISEAATDARVADILEKVYLETGTALSRKYGIPLAQQLEFAGTSRAKLRDPVIVDTLERNARDPLRKLGPDDRLVGSARLAIEYGARPEALAMSIAAAIWYDSPGDPSAESLKKMRIESGFEGVLENVCMVQRGTELFNLVSEKVDELRERGWIDA